MNKRGMDRSAVAAASGLPKDTFDNLFKSGRKRFPYADELCEMARALGTTAEYLVTGKETRNVITDPTIMKLIENLDMLNELDSYQVQSIAEQVKYLTLGKIREQRNGALITADEESEKRERLA